MKNLLGSEHHYYGIKKLAGVMVIIIRRRKRERERGSGTTKRVDVVIVGCRP